MTKPLSWCAFAKVERESGVSRIDDSMLTGPRAGSGAKLLAPITQEISDNDAEDEMESQTVRHLRHEHDLKRSTRVNARLVMLCLAGTFAMSPSAHAREVVLITQAKAMAGNVTPGDAPGFPVSITRPGSYRLTTNLRTPSGPAIEIVADNVSLNLNGFSIIGSSIWPSGAGITGNDRKHVRIHNGSVVGFSDGLRFQGDAQFVTLEKLHVNSITLFNSIPVLSPAIRLGENRAAFSIIRDVVAAGQVLITCPSLVVDTIADHGGVIEMDVPFNGTGRSFPVNCRGANVF